MDLKAAPASGNATEGPPRHGEAERCRASTQGSCGPGNAARAAAAMSGPRRGEAGLMDGAPAPWGALLMRTGDACLSTVLKLPGGPVLKLPGCPSWPSCGGGCTSICPAGAAGPTGPARPPGPSGPACPVDPDATTGTARPAGPTTGPTGPAGPLVTKLPSCAVGCGIARPRGDKVLAEEASSGASQTGRDGDGALRNGSTST